MSKMDPIIKARWVAALRSGEYKQATGLLRDANTGGFCCLGVLCDVYAKATHDDYWASASPDKTHPDDNVFCWAGFDGGPYGSSPKVKHAGQDNFLTNLNDSGVSFADIAKAIEEQL